MKRVFTLCIALLFAAAAFAQVVVNQNITSNTTWARNNTYLLDGFIYVKNGATLTIEPGTIIKGKKETKGTLIVTRGAKIVADGTPDQPIVFTSNESSPNYGDWGGIIILGKAPTNASNNGVDGEGVIEGGVDNAEGDGRYGGTDAADNSGVLRYVRIEYPGIAFAPNNEINGLTMGGVGSGTKIEYVQVSYANDDSFEWFGGTVNCKYLIAYRGLDDDFDADFGYSGNVQFALATRDGAVADVSGSNGFEVDNDATGSGRTPKTKPTFSNVTVVGPPAGNVAADYRRAAHLRRNNEIGIYNSVFIGSYLVGLFVDGDSIVNNATAGRMTVKNSFFHGMTEPLRTTSTSFDIAAWAATNQISVGTNSADAKLADPFNLALPNPRPQAGSPVLGYAKYDDARVNNFFFTQVGYAGAFGPSGDWTCPWAKFATPGCLPGNQEVVVSGNITANTTWTADKTYILQGFVYVKNCATLTIQPGTVIKGDKATKGTLIVTRCSKINAEGTEGQPIVFTGNDPNLSYGSWGGIILLGQAPTNASFQGQAGVGEIEGGVNNAAGDGLYGGTNAADNSGILKYVRIEYPGIAFAQNNEINGLTMGGVGSGTTIDNVQVSYCGDDSFEWFGGTVNCKHLIAYRGLDDDFDADFGYSGNVQYAIAVRDPLVADVSGSNGFEIDNDATGSTNTPKTKPTFSNVTIVGPTGAVAPDYRRAAHLRRNSEPGIFNSLFVGSYPVGLFIDGDATAQNALDGKLEIKNCVVAGPTELLRKATTNVTFDINAWFAASSTANQTFPTSDDAKLVDPFNLDDPNAAVLYNSPAYGKASFTAPRLQGGFFTAGEEIGAFEAGNDWTCPWAVWSGGPNTDCNVGTEEFENTVAAVKLFPTVTNDRATLQLILSQKSDLNVRIFDLKGQFFGSPVSQLLGEGEHTFDIETANLAPGFYLVQIEAGAAAKTMKMVVVH
ncbi:MAG: T9SS type A sorting domain-containing protein [Saprospiraceae bacterium]